QAPIEDQAAVDLEERKMGADPDRVIRGVGDGYLGRRPTGVQPDRPLAEQHLSRSHAVLFVPGPIGRSTLSTRVPSPNRHSSLTVPAKSTTPSSTSSSVRTLRAAAITSSYDAPPRAASCISSQ